MYKYIQLLDKKLISTNFVNKFWIMVFCLKVFASTKKNELIKEQVHAILG